MIAPGNIGRSLGENVHHEYVPITTDLRALSIFEVIPVTGRQYRDLQLQLSQTRLYEAVLGDPTPSRPHIRQ
jgi:hypothetical protein